MPPCSQCNISFVPSMERHFGLAPRHAAPVVSLDNRFSECGLMQPLFDRSERISRLRNVCWGSQSLRIGSKSYASLQSLVVPAGDERGEKGLVAAWCYSQEIDNRNL